MIVKHAHSSWPHGLSLTSEVATQWCAYGKTICTELVHVLAAAQHKTTCIQKIRDGAFLALP